MLRKLFGGNRARSGGAKPRQDGKDEAIIHLTVPDEVLFGDRKAVPEKDMSWLDGLPSGGTAGRSDARPAVRSPASPKVRTTPKAAVAEVMIAVEEPERVNARAEGRPRFPYGWLVIVEGPGTGEWFPLERGTSVVGPAGGQTIEMDFGDDTIGEDRVARLSFDEARHAFMLDSNGPFRVNGEAERSRRMLRDGDVFTIGGISMRLVALCSRNFHWAKDIAAE